MANRKQPGGLAVWLGIADNSFTRQKTVKFGDASAVNSGRLWSIVTLIALIVAWWVTIVGGVIDPIFWPPLEGDLYPWDNPNRAKPGVVDRFVGLLSEGYRDISLWEHVGTTVKRVLLGVFFGALAGIPLGFAMGLNSAARGLFDPNVEFVRPIPPLALIPLVILWLGIDEVAKVFLLFLAALLIMLIAAGAGVSSVQISKVHAAYSRGSTKAQALRHVILPNALPEIFTGLRTSMGGVPGNAGRCRPGSRLDDDDRQGLPPDQRDRDRHHHHWRDRLRHRNVHAGAGGLADSLEGEGLMPRKGN